MPVNRETLEQYVDEVAGGDMVIREAILKAIGEKDEAATRFVGGYTRTADYTQKRQADAEAARLAQAKVVEYEGALQEADKKITKTMKDLATSRIDQATATARLNHIKDKYALGDDDIPTAAEVRLTGTTGRDVSVSKDGSVDIEERLKDFRGELMKSIGDKLIPELAGMARLDVIWEDVGQEHQHLFGKRLTRSEREELLEEAKRGVGSIEQLWEKRYKVGDKRLEIRDVENKARWEKEWHDAQVARRSQELIDGAHKPSPMEGPGSPVFGRKYKTHGDPIPEPGKTVESIAPARNESPADKMARNYLNRRAAGIPLGKEAPTAA